MNDHTPRQALNTGERLGWFRRHQTYAWAGLLATMMAFLLGLVMWLGARLADRPPATLLVLLHLSAGVVGVVALLITTRVAWARPQRPSLAQVVTRSQQWILQHRLLAFASLVCGAVMAFTGGGALIGWLLDESVPSLIYGHLLTGVLLAPLVVATFLIGRRPVRWNRFGR